MLLPCHPNDRLRSGRQRALPSGLPPLAGVAASAAGAKGLRPLDSHAPPGLLRLRAGRGMLRALHPYKKWSAALRFFTACLLKTLPEYGRI